MVPPSPPQKLINKVCNIRDNSRRASSDTCHLVRVMVEMHSDDLGVDIQRHLAKQWI